MDLIYALSLNQLCQFNGGQLSMTKAYNSSIDRGNIFIYTAEGEDCLVHLTPKMTFAQVAC